MLARLSTIATFITLAELCRGSTVSKDFALHQNSDPAISHLDIIRAFTAAGHPDAVARQTWEDENGTTYQTLWDFDTNEWNAMHDRLLAETTGNNDTAGPLLAREQPDGEHTFVCHGYNERPWTYTVTAGLIVAGVCRGFNYGIQWLGKTQIIERNDLHNIRHERIKTTFKYTWEELKWASEHVCTIAITYGLDKACTAQKDGKKATRGEKMYYHGATVGGVGKLHAEAEFQTHKK